jgi:hypothetical protein
MMHELGISTLFRQHNSQLTGNKNMDITLTSEWHGRQILWVSAHVSRSSVAKAEQNSESMAF